MKMFRILLLVTFLLVITLPGYSHATEEGIGGMSGTGRGASQGNAPDIRSRLGIDRETTRKYVSKDYTGAVVRADNGGKMTLSEKPYLPIPAERMGGRGAGASVAAQKGSAPSGKSGD